MKHFILVQYLDRDADRERLYAEIKTLFEAAKAMDGVTDVRLSPAVILGENRYDLMICVEMARNALPAFDASPLHLEWKERFGPLLKQKAIFDCE